MALTNTPIKVQYDLSGGAVASYVFGFRFWATSEVKAMLSTSSGDTLLTEGVDYSVSAAGVGGTVTILSTLPAATRLTIYRELVAEQGIDLVNGGIQDAEVYEAGLDKSVALVQQVNETLSRSVRFPVSDTLTSSDMPSSAVRKSRFLAFDDSGDPIAASSPVVYPVSAYMETLLDDSNAATARATLELGSASVLNSDFFATAAQGTKADAALPSASYTAADVVAKANAGYGYTPAPQVARPNVKTPWATPTLYAPDPLRAAVEAATGGRVTVLYDDQGNPSYMCVIPKFKVEDIHADFGTGVHPAFIVGGVEKPYLMIAQNLASQIGSRAVSLPGKDPWCSITYDAAKTACTSKGTGWHLMTNWEWAAITLWMLKNGFQPRGNSNYGRAHDALHETAPRQDGLAPGTASGTARNGCGLGPAGWRHDNTPVGIADLVGNVWEWQDGLKLVDGQFMMPNDNEYTLAEGSWPGQGVYLESSGTTGTDTVASGNGAPQLSASRLVPSDDCGDGLGSSAPDYDYTSIGGDTGWRTVALTAGYDALALATRQKMMQSMLAAKLTQATAAPYSAKGYIAARNYGERIPIRGGSWDDGSHVGVAALNLSTRRSYAYILIGFRPAFLP